MGEAGSWRSPRRLALLALGVATVIFLVGPMLVVIPMSFTGAQILSWPPEGFSLQWYAKMLDDPQWSRGLRELVAGGDADRDPLDDPRHARGARDRARPLSGQGPRERPDPQPADRPGDHHRDRVLRVLLDHPPDGLAAGARAHPHGPRGAVRDHQRGSDPADDGPQPRARRGQPRGRSLADVLAGDVPDHPARRVRRGAVRVHHVVGRGRRVDLHDQHALPDAAGRDVGAGPPGRRSRRSPPWPRS